jgi:hypothetical protein
MSFGWIVLSWFFYGMFSQPKKGDYQLRTLDDLKKKYPEKSEDEYSAMLAKEEAERNVDFNRKTDRWLQLHRLAGSGYAAAEYYPVDGVERSRVEVWGGKLRTWPWFEDRGPNPYLLVTGKTDAWKKEPLADWFISSEVPVLLEPLVKFLTPVIELLNPKNGFGTRVYLLFVILWTCATWALFGGAITRMAAVELAGKDSVTIRESIQFVLKRYVSYLLAPLVPLILVAVLVFICFAFGLLHSIPILGDIVVSGIGWPIMILVGLGMALLLVGLIGYPLMYPTISTEGSDTLDALTRSYNYVFTAPWNYIGYSALTVLYGAIVVFFVGFMGSLTVYLGKWGVSSTILFSGRSPEFLFVHAPTSFGWKQLLLADSPGGEYAAVEDELVSLRHKRDGQELKQLTDPNTPFGNRKSIADKNYQNWWDSFYLWNKIGAVMVWFWITLLLLMILGFGYSFFWTSSTMIYLLMRKKVDEMDLDEIYLEEPEEDDIFGGPPTTPLPSTEAAAPGGTTQLQETLGVRQDREAPPADSLPSQPPPPTSPPPEESS